MKRVKLGKLVSIQTGKLDANAAVENGKYPFFTTAKEISWIDNYAYDDEVVLVAGNGDLNVKYYQGKFNAYQRTYILTSNDTDIRMKYLYYFLEKYVEVLRLQSIGGVIKYIKLSNLTDAKIPLRSIVEQEQIISILEQLDNQIFSRQQQVSKLSNLVKSQFHEMFGDIFNTKFSIFKLEELCEFIKDGTHQTPKYTDDKINGFKFLSSKDVTSGKISWESIKYIPEDLHNELYSKIAPKRNDILLAKNGTTGVAALVDCDDIFDIYVSLAILRFHEGNNPKYLLYAINSDGTKWQFNSSLKGVGVPNLHLGEIRKTKIPLPPLALQNQFADFVAEVDKSQLAGQMVLKLWRKLLKFSIIKLSFYEK